MAIARTGRLSVGSILLAMSVAACSAGATTPPVTPPAATAVPSAPASASASASVAPSPSVAAASPSASNGGRYGYGGGAGDKTPAPGLVVKVAKTSAGDALAGTDGLTLYVHAGDSKNRSTCTGGCLAAWPAVVVTAGAKVTAGSGVHGTLGTFTRPDDGTVQVTYNGRPLYTWPGDTNPGDATGDGIGGFTIAKP